MVTKGVADKAANLHGVSLGALSAQQLTELIAAAEETRRDKVESEKQKLVEEMRARAAEIGVDPDVLFGHRAPAAAPVRRRRSSGSSDARKDVIPKFRGPNGETWSGRGRMPRWLHEAEAKGHKRVEFAV